MTLPEVSRVPRVSGVVAGRWRQARLRKHADFETVYRSGRRLFSTHMTIFFLGRDTTNRGLAGAPDPVRVGFTVPRALGTAVERNRIRRRMREAVRLNLGAAGSGVDIVIHPKRSALRAGFVELQGEVARAFEKIQLQVTRRQSPTDRAEGS